MSEPDQITMILQERGSRYGDFKDHAQITQALKDIAQATANWKILTPAMKEALDMTFHKIGRILNGDPNYADSWIDVCGYNQLVVDILQQEEVVVKELSDIIGSSAAPASDGLNQIIQIPPNYFKTEA
jgi:hypothetical protein